MPDPTPTPEDRELAEAFVAAAIFADFQAYQVGPDDIVTALAEFRAQARREGREKGLREAKSGSIAIPPDCENLWHYDPTWTYPWCPVCHSRERRDPADQPAPGAKE